LSDQEHATFIAGSLIALQDATFAKQYRDDYTKNPDRFIRSMLEAISENINSCKGFDKSDKRSIVSAEFSFIGRNEQLKKIVSVGGKTWIAVQYILTILDDGVVGVAKQFPEYDILGAFYNQFAKYSASDQQTLGIVLTPHHIASFMSELLDVQDHDVVLDTCCGSASLLLTAGGFAAQSIGVELNSRMTAIALANMIIKDRPTYLWLGDSFDITIQKEISAYHPNKLIINPPYSQQDNKELSFIEEGLSLLEKDGLGVVILPTTCVGTGDNFTIQTKERLLQNHTLLATFSLHDKVFAPAVSVRTMILLFKAHCPNGNYKTQMIRLDDDGFVSVKNQGRQDIYQKWPAIKTEIMNLYVNHTELNGKSIIKSLTANDSWNIENHIVYDGSLVEEEKFAKKLEEYYSFLYPKADYPFDRRVKGKWKDFKYTDLFTIDRGKGPKSVEAEASLGLTPFVAAANNNNGVRFLTSYDPIYKAGTISIGNSGNGACGIAYYHSYPYTAASTATILTPKKSISDEAGIFIATIISQEHETHGFGNGLSNAVLKTLTLSLPVNENDEPDYELMSNYIRNLPNYKNLS
jgi:type I restriction-modification system DNA methylase subunit